MSSTAEVGGELRRSCRGICLGRRSGTCRLAEDGMAEPIRTDLCVIGAGSGGLAVAAGAVQMGAKVVLIEQGKMGGDCLNYGCVPSKSLIAAGRAAHAMRTAGRFGVNGHEPAIDFLGVHDHVKGVIAAIAPHDSQERFEKLGVEVHPRPCPLRRAAGGRGGRAAHSGAPDRGRDRLVPRRAADPGSRRSAAPDQRDGVRPDRAAGAPGRDRRRPDRLRAGSGIPAPGRAGDRARAALDPAQGRSRRGRGGARPAARRRHRPARAGRGRSRRSGRQRHRPHARGTTAPSGASPAATCWWPRAGAPTSMVSISRPAASSTAQRASRSTRACAPATSGSTRSATSRAACSSPTWRRITPAW